MAQPTNIAFYRSLEYAQADGINLTLDLYGPERADRKAPLYIWVYGAAWLNRRMFYYGVPAMGILQHGFAVAKIDYRMSGEAKFPAQIIDVKTAIRFLRSHAEKFGLDPERFVISGESSGGHLSSLAALTPGVPEFEGPLYPGVSSAVQAAVLVYAPSDLTTMYEQTDFSMPGTSDHNAPDSPESLLIGGPVQECRERALWASPVSYVKDNRSIPPFLMFHGTADNTVPCGQSAELYALLKAEGADAAYYPMEGRVHSFDFLPEAEPIILEFLKQKL